MTPDQALKSHRAFINAAGEDIVVRRYGDDAPTEATTRARVMGYLPNQIVGSVTAGDRRVIALVDTLAAMLPLTRKDKLVIRGREVAIKAVDDSTRRIGGTLIALEIQADG
jgi:hypothetical protein